jgi:Fe2+ transport system protein FeoA
MRIGRRGADPTSSRGRRRRGAAPRAPEGALTLDAVGSGRRVRVIGVHGNRGLVHRLAALGLVPGCVVTVRRSRGPALLSVGGARIAIGRRAAMAVEVEEADA